MSKVKTKKDRRCPYCFIPGREHKTPLDCSAAIWDAGPGVAWEAELLKRQSMEEKGPKPE